jgi:hypothetical protein
MDDFLIEHPRTGDLVSRDALASPWRHKPALLPEAEAQAKADELRQLTGNAWRIELAPNECPECAREIDANRPDFAHTLGARRDRWRAGCNEHDGGCGFEVEGESYEDALTRWNRASAKRRTSTQGRRKTAQAGRSGRAAATSARRAASQ